MRKRSSKFITALLAVLILSALLAAGSMAYFSDYEVARGEATLHLNGQTEIEEKIVDGNKVISIKNIKNTTADADVLEAPAVVRVAVYGPKNITVTPAVPEDWEEHNGYYYYTKVLGIGESTSDLTAEIELTEEEAENTGDHYDVVVVHESALPVYEQTEDGKNKVRTPEGWDYLPSIIVE